MKQNKAQITYYKLQIVKLLMQVQREITPLDKGKQSKCLYEKSNRSCVFEKPDQKVIKYLDSNDNCQRSSRVIFFWLL